MNNHTPTPWRVINQTSKDIDNCDDGFNDVGQFSIYPKGSTLNIAACHPYGFSFGWADLPTAKSNAEFIVRACNAHDDLVSLAKEVIQFGDCNPALRDDESGSFHALYYRAVSVKALATSEVKHESR